ncbi:hypothetical protein MT418_003769 [Batrachochytrium dendrobatidis]
MGLASAAFPSSTASFANFSTIAWRSSAANRFGTSPALSKLLTSSIKDSSRI